MSPFYLLTFICLGLLVIGIGAAVICAIVYAQPKRNYGKPRDPGLSGLRIDARRK